ncbi:MAG: NFACT family protein [Bacteroides sp.]|nr:NFACT family protein [Bacteroides sp.]MCM1548553.1 NFACT family protein [Clostridium sp.]
MAFDGITVASIVHELKSNIRNGRIYKIYQPEPDEINLIIKTPQGTHRLLLSASATLPLLYLSTENKNNPVTAPAFCMLLRKHIGNGRIVEIEQPDFERIVVFTIEHLDEMGDLCRKKLIIEIMGKHSNIIFCDETGRIIDSIKRISAQTSSVREVLPGRDYVLPPSQGKMNPLRLTRTYYEQNMLTKPVNLCKMIYTSLTGFSPVAANEICDRAGLDGDISTSMLMMDGETEGWYIRDGAEGLWEKLSEVTEQIRQEKFQPGIYYDEEDTPIEFSAIRLTMYSDMEWKQNPSISAVLQEYYAAKNNVTRIRQKSSDLRRVVSTAMERTAKKYDLQCSQLKDTEKRDKYRVYGELIHTYGYGIEPEAASFQALNYYTNEEITIPLDPTLTPMENSKKYFARYNKLKRTWEALTEQVAQTKQELEHLRSIQTALDITLEENDLADIKRELMEYGYIKFKGPSKKKGKLPKSKPFHYVSSDGFHMYVGKNNYQNEELTFKMANGGDLWFHAKQTPGSHVIVKTEGNQDIPDRTYEEAARLAAYYSSARTSSKVDIDYTRRSNLKKTPGGAPGFVIYHTNYSMTIEPDIRGIAEAED